MSTIITLIIIYLIYKHLDKKTPPDYYKGSEGQKRRKAAEEQFINGLIMLEDED